MKGVMMLVVLLLSLPAFGCAGSRSSLTLNADAESRAENLDRPEVKVHMTYRVDMGN